MSLQKKGAKGKGHVDVHHALLHNKDVQKRNSAQMEQGDQERSLPVNMHPMKNQSKNVFVIKHPQ